MFSKTPSQRAQRFCPGLGHAVGHFGLLQIAGELVEFIDRQSCRFALRLDMLPWTSITGFP